jgi:hypothetical protein
MGALTKVNPNLPAVFQGVGTEEFDEYKGGVVSGFPVISFRGRTWRVKKGGDEQVYLNDEQEAVQSIEVVMVRSNPVLAKIFYESSYSEGDNAAPRCWSGNGIKPDAGVQNPISKVCATCPNNQWGSKVTPSGAKTRACADHRRMAVAFRHELEAQAAGETDDTGKVKEATLLLLRVPPASLNPLKDFIEKVLQPKGVPPFAVFIKVGFDTTVSYPKLTFRGSQFLNDDQAQIVMGLRESEDIKRILAEVTEYSAAGTTGDEVEVEAGGEGAAALAETPTATKTTKPAPAASKPKPAARPSPVEEEEAHSADDGIAPASTATQADESDEIAPPQPTAKPKPAAAKPAAAKPAAAPKPAAAKPAAKPKPQAAAPVEEAADHVENPSGGEEAKSFEDMLDSLLD